MLNRMKMKRRKRRTALAPALLEHVGVRLEARGAAAVVGFLNFAGDLLSFQELNEKCRVRLVGSGVPGGRHRRVGMVWFGGSRIGELHRIGLLRRLVGRCPLGRVVEEACQSANQGVRTCSPGLGTCSPGRKTVRLNPGRESLSIEGFFS